MKDYIYFLKFQVRDYECDLQGVVNNAVYLNYIEHTRHEFLKNILEFDFAKLHSEGIDPMAYRIEIDYKSPLKSGDKFICKLNIALEGRLKMILYVDIYKESDNKLISKTKTTVILLKNGRPIAADLFVSKAQKFFNLEYMKN